MNGLDWLLLLLILLSALLATAQGFVTEVFSLAGALVGYLLAAWEYPRVAPLFAKYVSSPWVADIAAFLTIFLCVVLLAGVLARIVRWAVSGVCLRWFDRVLGGVFGIVRGLAVAAVIVMAMAAFIPNSSSLRESAFAPYFLVLGRTATWMAPPDLRAKFRQGVNLLRSAEAKAPPSEPSPSKTSK
jgi:membrane protein required for colicin V production